MAIFAPASSGYADTNRALSIKALEKRYADMMAQQSQPDTSLMATIPGGIGHVLGVVGDKLNEGRAAAALEANKQELAATMAQIDPEKGPTPQQGATIARLAPDIFKDYMDRQHQRWTTQQTNQTTQRGQDLTLQGIQGTNQTTQRGQDMTLQGIREREAGDTGRTVIQTTSAEKIANEGNVLKERLQTSQQGHDAYMARLNAELKDAEQQKLFAQQNGQADKANAQQERIARLTAELNATENRKQEEFKASELEKKFAADANLQRLAQEAKRAELQIQIAAQAREGGAQREATERLERIKGDIAAGRDKIAQEHEAGINAAKIKSNEAISAAEIKSKEDIAKAAQAAAERDPKRIEARAQLEKEAVQHKLMVEELQSAKKDLDAGINTGFGGSVKTFLGQATGGYLSDEDRANRTVKFDATMEGVATGKMSTLLKGATTDKEMEAFKRIWNNTRSTLEQRREAFGRVLRAAEQDAIIGEAAVKRAGGPLAGESAPAAAAAKDPAAELAKAQRAIDNGAPMDAVADLLRKNGGDPAGLKPKAR